MIYLLWSGIVILTFSIVFLLTQSLNKRVRNFVISGMIAIFTVYIPISNAKSFILVPLILLPAIGLSHADLISVLLTDFVGISVLIYLTVSIIFFLWVFLLMTYYHLRKEIDHKSFLLLLLAYIVSLIFLESSLFSLGEFDCIPETGKLEMYQYYLDTKPSFGEALKRAFTFCELYYDSHSVFYISGPSNNGFISFVIAILGLVISKYLFKKQIMYISGKYFFGINVQRFIAVILLIVNISFLLWLVYGFVFLIGYGIAMSLAH